MKNAKLIFFPKVNSMGVWIVCYFFVFLLTNKLTLITTSSQLKWSSIYEEKIGWNFDETLQFLHFLQLDVFIWHRVYTFHVLEFFIMTCTQSLKNISSFLFYLIIMHSVKFLQFQNYLLCTATNKFYSLNSNARGFSRNLIVLTLSSNELAALNVMALSTLYFQTKQKQSTLSNENFSFRLEITRRVF